MDTIQDNTTIKTPKDLDISYVKLQKMINTFYIMLWKMDGVLRKIKTINEFIYK